MTATFKTEGTTRETVTVGLDNPVETHKSIKSDLNGIDGPFAETGVLIGISIPLPAPAGQKMGPWAKVDVNITVPCINNKDEIDKISKYCQKYAQERVAEIVKEIISRSK